MLLSYFNHPTDARTRVRPRLRAIVTGECIPLRQYRGNMNGKMNGVSFCSRMLLLHVLFIAYQFSPLLSYAHFNLAIARARAASRPGQRDPLGGFYFSLYWRVWLTSSIRRPPRVHKQPSALESLCSRCISLFFFFFSFFVFSRNRSWIAILFDFCVVDCANSIFLTMSHDIFWCTFWCGKA